MDRNGGNRKGRMRFTLSTKPPTRGPIRGFYGKKVQGDKREGTRELSGGRKIQMVANTRQSLPNPHSVLRLTSRRNFTGFLGRDSAAVRHILSGRHCGSGTVDVEA